MIFVCLVWSTIVVSDTCDGYFDNVVNFICLFISRRENLLLFNLCSSIVFELESLDTSLGTLFNILYRQVRTKRFLSCKFMLDFHLKNVGNDCQRIVNYYSIK